MAGTRWLADRTHAHHLCRDSLLVGVCCIRRQLRFPRIPDHQVPRLKHSAPGRSWKSSRVLSRALPMPGALWRALRLGAVVAASASKLAKGLFTALLRLMPSGASVWMFHDVPLVGGSVGVGVWLCAGGQTRHQPLPSAQCSGRATFIFWYCFEIRGPDLLAGLLAPLPGVRI